MKLRLFLLIISLISLNCQSTALEPIGGSTSIYYGVSQQSHVKLIILNSYNTEIAKVVDKVQDPGAYKITIQHNDYNMIEGVYFIKLYFDHNLSRTLTLILENQ